MLLKKEKERAGAIIILHLYTKNLNDMIYLSRDIVWETEIGNYGLFFALLPH